MRNVMKATTLESRFPLLAVEHGCIISKDADITAAFEVELPEVYTVTAEEYEGIHATWCKAIKVLPDYSVLHKQDWYVKEEYRPDWKKTGTGFLARSNGMHFNERPFLNHRCYLYLTKTTGERMRRQSNWSTLCRGHIIPKEIQDRETAVKFMEAVEQFARILNDSGRIRLRRLSDDELTGTEKETGIVGRYLALSPGNTDCLEDIAMSAEEMRIGDKRLCLHTLSDTEDLPAAVETDYRYESLSTDRSDCRLSFAAPLGLLLPCNHIYNQYVFVGNSDEELRRFEKSARNMQSLSRYSRQNAINCEWIEEYLNEAHSQGLKSVRAHFNVMAWSDDGEELKRIRNDVGSQLASMGCVPRHNTTDCPTLFWAGIPGNAADFPAEESFHTFVEQSVCLFTGETNYRDSPSAFGIRMADRISGKPLMSVAVCLSLKPTLRQNFSMCTSSWNSGNHVCAFEMMDFKNDTFFWCSASLSAISLRCLACISINCRWCSSCCRCICCCNSSMLSSRAVTLLCRAWLSASNSLSLPLPKREPTFATNAAFASVLAASSFSDLISCLTLSSCCSACRCSVCNCCTLASNSPVCRFRSR